uniref:Putative ixodes 10 kDa peptide protein n=1 Tax=Ixodes ricinus TaxID=34613 RepID=A0A0K8RM49_IXORI
MCRNISNMLFVLFPVVLRLAASQEEGFSSAAFECYRALLHSGDIYCQLSGHDKFDGLSYETCQLACGSTNVQLPEEVCPKGRMPKTCNEDDLSHLRNWSKNLMEKKEYDLNRKNNR